MAKKKRGLGRGLDALLGPQSAASPEPVSIAPDTPDANEAGAPEPDAGAEKTAPALPADGDLRRLPIEFLQRGRYQPRRDMDQQALEELAESIKAQGVMQPIVVRPVPGSADERKYEIIAGERRWRASQIAGLDEVPCVVREVPDEAAIAMALIENIQREDLNCMEEALALSRLQQEFTLTHQEVAEAVGKSRSAVSNILRLMSLREDVQTMLERGDLEMGHAKALLGLPPEQQSKAAHHVAGKGLSVRQTESYVRRLLSEHESGKATGPSTEIDPDIKRLQDDLSEKFGAPVQIEHSAKGKGKLVFKYNNLHELDGILKKIR